jgi:hypothetical protein
MGDLGPRTKSTKRCGTHLLDAPHHHYNSKPILSGCQTADRSGSVRTSHKCPAMSSLKPKNGKPFIALSIGPKTSQATSIDGSHSYDCPTGWLPRTIQAPQPSGVEFDSCPHLVRRSYPSILYSIQTNCGGLRGAQRRSNLRVYQYGKMFYNSSTIQS